MGATSDAELWLGLNILNFFPGAKRSFYQAQECGSMVKHLPCIQEAGHCSPELSYITDCASQNGCCDPQCHNRCDLHPLHTRTKWGTVTATTCQTWRWQQCKRQDRGTDGFIHQAGQCLLEPQTFAYEGRCTRPWNNQTNFLHMMNRT